ncbi:MAG: ATP-grasp domain-containing protein [Pirellulales bacterium]|nr:ATP-grasp domain-containing protein [Pirellulales bacterium]
MPARYATTEADLLIAGASARAAAFSVLSAGLKPAALDLFADEDLAARCVAMRVARWPGGLAGAARRLPAFPWLYTGGLENHPRIVDAIARERPLWGNSAAVLRRVRDPRDVAETLRRATIEVPQLRRASDSPPADGRWLIKSTASSGGLGVHAWDGTVRHRSGKWYFQQRIDGRSIAAVYLGGNSDARLLGVTEQLVGTRWRGAQPFAYAGSIGPLHPSPRIVAQLETIGSCLAKTYQLQGLFGVDMIRDQHGRLWPVDVNPRYPASAEVLELASGVSLIGLHVQACDAGELPSSRLKRQRTCAGKAIVYAPCDFVVPRSLNRRWHAANDARRETGGTPRHWYVGVPPYQVADIPAAGTAIPGGSPVVTLIECGDLSTVRGKLRRRASTLRRHLQALGHQEPSSLRMP